ncbi:MAG TPA: ABC transporter substrate-binding protein [Gemmatimonadaceae bacterium]|nr:ABC transporter substrate-binding protein [Gemmatimonadaceae bacterium]
MKGANQPWCPATLLGAWAMVVLALAGCAREDDRHPASTLRLLYDGDERQMFAGLRFPTQFLLFLPLVAHDERHEIEGRLARAWSHSDDHRDWTSHLRTAVRWHDGVPVTAHDVKFTSELFDAMWGTTRGAGVTVHDDSTLTIRFARPTDALD